MYDSIDQLFTRAESLLAAGMHRRAARLLRDIATSPETPDSARKRAWHMIGEPQISADEKRRQGMEKALQAAQRHQQLVDDRKLVMAYFNQGYSAPEVQSMTGRSKAFVAAWHKKWADLQ
ncbi:MULTISPECIES: hypothetical protein [Mangrovibacter]|uniref:Uncharacterized protein n=1 Tax=Mangrovibacter plantisponsor TaxID=451513 RepID=A0A317PQ74_9ENTR|nr:MULTISPECIES: hypothetical protein [Mangrovibacter]KEA52362.1 hypothetical protein DT73_15855 [Mangrovibacter sp. MFB070]PWW02667.1 hypothetical protein DES37_11821 [Mangrovibacter plantisponsor]